MRELLREQQQASPFQPFRLHTSDGRHFDVQSAEWMLVTNLTTALAVPDSTGQSDQLILISNDRILSLTPLRNYSED